MAEDLHAAIRRTISEWAAGNSAQTEAGPVFDAGHVSAALLEVTAEVAVSGPPDTRWSFVSRLHTLFDELVLEKQKVAVNYPGAPK